MISLTLPVVVLPINLLWTVQIHLRKKIALGCIFSLSVFIMVASIVRMAVYNASGTNDTSWLCSWSAIEMAIGSVNLLNPTIPSLILTAIIVACLASFRALFTSTAKSQRLSHQQKDHPIDPERQAFKNLGFHNTDRSLVSISAVNVSQDPALVFNPFTKKASVDQQPKHKRGLKNGFAEQGYTLSAITAGKCAVPVNDHHIHVHSEYSVYPETPTREGSR